MTRQANIMRRPNLIAGLLIVLVLSAAPSTSARRQKQTQEHVAAIRKCNDDYNKAGKQANADYKAAVKSANRPVWLGQSLWRMRARQSRKHWRRRS